MIRDTRIGRLRYRLVSFGGHNIYGPAGEGVRWIDICSATRPWRPDPPVTDADLVEQFDRGMELAPFLDWLAERHPHLLGLATSYGRLADAGQS